MEKKTPTLDETLEWLHNAVKELHEVYDAMEAGFKEIPGQEEAKLRLWMQLQDEALKIAQFAAELNIHFLEKLGYFEPYSEIRLAENRRIRAAKAKAQQDE
jgi:hypothetical protein